MENFKRNIEKYFNDYRITNPCPMCSHYEKEIYDYDCSECCYFYASNFELKPVQTKKEEKNDVTRIN